ncbi:FAD-dependent monooxygenase [Sediminimonas sp.]|uniref:FAD-dependent monooxygenase n=1 Tax=Sediminimonas sp. TaxID=2823379 RepID=UPI0025F81E7C|nr:FAD-dependent monooxygenase [Sediminimonas sp.]
MQIEGLKAVVIGAGIGGLAVARALALRGARVTVLEQAEAIEEAGAGLQISPNGAAVLRALGLEEGLRAGGAIEARAVALHDQAGAPVLRLDLTQLSARGYHFVHRADLVDLLAQGARDAGVKIRLLQQVDRVTPGPRPRLVMANGAELDADLVVGADGLHSRLRPVLNGADAPFFTGQVAWRAVIDAAGLDAAPVARVDMGAGRHVVSYPLRAGAARNIVAVEERGEWTAEGWHHRADPDAMRAAFAGLGPQVREMLARVETVNVWGLFRHPVARVWQHGHCALLGDAAHPTLPFLAQGACMALEDAWVLTDALAAGDSIDAGLAAYQQRRAPRVRRVIAAANGNAWKYHLRRGPFRLAAHAALRLGGRLAPGAMVHSFDWLYEHDVTQAG